MIYHQDVFSGNQPSQLVTCILRSNNPDTPTPKRHQAAMGCRNISKQLGQKVTPTGLSDCDSGGTCQWSYVSWDPENLQYAVKSCTGDRLEVLWPEETRIKLLGIKPTPHVWMKNVSKNTIPPSTMEVETSWFVGVSLRSGSWLGPWSKTRPRKQQKHMKVSECLSQFSLWTKRCEQTNEQRAKERYAKE